MAFFFSYQVSERKESWKNILMHLQYDEYVSETLEYQSSRYDKLCQKDFIRHHPSPVFLVLFFSSTHVTSEN